MKTEGHQFPLMDFKHPKRKLIVSQPGTVLTLVLLLCLAAWGLNIVPVAWAATKAKQGTHGTTRTYTTKFPLTENPVSESTNWINGKAEGLDWADVRTTPGFAFGAQSGTNGYDDSTALLTGTWGPDQTAEATVHLGNQGVPPIYEEVELRLRSAISAHKCTGYEINFQARSVSNAYVQIVRWNGPLGSFTYVTDRNGPGLHDGDVVKATIQGSTITVYLNGTQILQGTDSTYATGAPGMGFFLQGATGLNADYGFTSFTATDGPEPPPAPSNLVGSAH